MAMENRARYILVGLFTLAVITAGFAFTYWLNTAGALQQRSYYRIRYQNSVAGLLVGSAVQFNGVRVGEVTALDLSPDNPKDVVVTIAITPSVPVRADTKAGIAFQGLMGAPAVALAGGSGAPLSPETSSADMPVLIAEPNAGETMTEAALAALHRVDAVVSENAEPLKSTIANLSKFTDALARNSDRVDGILAGIERMTGGASKSQTAVFDLTAARTFPKFEKPAVGLLVVQYPIAAAMLGQDKILIRDAGELRPFTPEAKWSDMLLEEVQSSIVQSFENAGFLGQVSRPVEGATPDFQLVTDIRNFQILAGTPVTADVEFSAKILNSEGHVVGARLFHASRPLHSEDAVGAAGALDAAFGSMLPDLVVWTSTTIGNVASAPH
jgi:phospholipid/cholesterol/gamma-HCH transport system substrate-binding protein